MKWHTALTLAASVALTLSACSAPTATVGQSSAPTESQVAAESAEPSVAPTLAASSVIPCNDPSCDPNGGLFPVDGKYEFTGGAGAKGAFTFNAKADPDVEYLHKEAGGTLKMHYMNIKIDNREGSEYVNANTVVAFDKAGKKYEFTSLSQQISEWGPTMTEEYDYFLADGTEFSEAKYDELNSLSVDLHNKYLDGVDVSEVGTVVLAYGGKLPKYGFTRVEVQGVGGYDDVNAYLEGQEPPAADGDGAGADLHCADETQAP